jgi:hypothetical protein
VCYPCQPPIKDYLARTGTLLSVAKTLSYMTT